MFRSANVLTVAVLLSSCAGTDAQLRMLENGNALQIEPANAPGADYVVRIKNVIDIGYDPDNLETRRDVTLRSMKAQCPSATIVNEKVIDKGTYAIGRPAREYFEYVKCS